MFERFTENEVSSLPALLESRLPKSSQLYNRTILYIQSGRSLPHFEFSFYCFKGLPLSTTSIVSNLRRSNKSFWIILGPESDSEDTIECVVKSFGKIVVKSEPNSFNAVENKLCSIFERLFQVYENGETEDFHPVYWMRIEEALQLQIQARTETSFIRELVLDDIETVMKYWKYASSEERDAILTGVLLIGSAGVVVGGELVSWAVCLPDGAIHALYTKEEHRGKGLGKLTMKFLCRLLASRGYIPTTQVEGNNPTSKSLMRNVGFELSHAFRWLEINKIDSEAP